MANMRWLKENWLGAALVFIAVGMLLAVSILAIGDRIELNEILRPKVTHAP